MQDKDFFHLLTEVLMESTHSEAHELIAQARRILASSVERERSGIRFLYAISDASPPFERMQSNEELLAQEIANTAPENHRNYDANTRTMWCPWAYANVVVSRDHRDWPICSGCQRVVDTVSASRSR